MLSYHRSLDEAFSLVFLSEVYMLVYVKLEHRIQEFGPD